MYNRYQPQYNYGMPNVFPYQTYPQYQQQSQQVTPMVQTPQVPQMQPTQTNTNKIFVSGLDDVKQKQLTPNSNYIFLDNDNPILYEKIVDGTGQFEIKEYDIKPRFRQQDTKGQKISNLSREELSKELEPLKAEIKGIQRELGKLMANNEVKNAKRESKD